MDNKTDWGFKAVEAFIIIFFVSVSYGTVISLPQSNQHNNTKTYLSRITNSEQGLITSPLLVATDVTTSNSALTTLLTTSLNTTTTAQPITSSINQTSASLNATIPTSTALTSITPTSTLNSTSTMTSLNSTSTTAPTNTSTPGTTTIPLVNTSTAITTTTLNTTSTSSSVQSTQATTSLPAANTTNLTLNYKNNKNIGGVLARGMQVIAKPDNSFLKGLQLNLTSPGLDINISIENESIIPAYMPKPSSAYYQYLQINGSVGGGAENIDQYVNHTTYYFSVPSAWITAQRISPGQVALFKYDGSQGSWLQLPTELTGYNATYYSYSATSSSLSGYVVGFTTSSTTTHTVPTVLNIATGWETYFYAIGSQTKKTGTATKFPTNFINFTSNEIIKIGGTSSLRFTNESIIGYNDFYGSGHSGNFIAPTGYIDYNTVMAGIGANVIFNNNGFTSFTTNTGSSANTLSFTTSVANEVVFILYAIGGNSIHGNPHIPAGAGCTLDSNANIMSQAAAATANCIVGTAGTYTAAIPPNTATGLGYANSIAAIGFGPYGLWLEDSPATGNIATSPCVGCNVYDQQNGNVVNVIGDNIITPVTPSGYTFSGWSVDTFNSANVVLTPESGTTTNAITVMGNAILTATYKSTSAAVATCQFPVGWVCSP